MPKVRRHGAEYRKGREVLGVSIAPEGKGRYDARYTLKTEERGAGGRRLEGEFKEHPYFRNMPQRRIVTIQKLWKGFPKRVDFRKVSLEELNKRLARKGMRVDLGPRELNPDAEVIDLNVKFVSPQDNNVYLANYRKEERTGTYYLEYVADGRSYASLHYNGSSHELFTYAQRHAQVDVFGPVKSLWLRTLKLFGRGIK